MDPTIAFSLSLIFNILLGVISFMLKQAYKEVKEDNKSLWDAVTHIKDNYFKREEFSEFKQELWHRLDGFKNDVKDQIRELKK